MAIVRPNTIQLTNCTCENTLDNLQSTETYTFVLNADKGNRFEEVPQFVVYGLGVSRLLFTLSDDQLKATITVNFADYSAGAFDIIATAEPYTYYKNYGAVNVYKVNADILNNFAAVRYGGADYNDLGEFVISLKRFYCELGETTPNKISCANFTTNVDAETPLYDVVNINCGSVTIPAVNNSSLDFESEIEIFLPFIGFRSLSSDYVGKTISLIYDIDIIRGVGVAKLICDEIIFDIMDCVPCVDVLFKPLSYQTSLINVVDKSAYGLTPYIIVKSLPNANTLKMYPQSERRKLNNFEGLCKIVDVDFAVSPSNIADNTVLEEIRKLLEEGVYMTNPKNPT